MSAAAFDAIAATYDAAFTRTAVGSTLRAMVWSRLEQAFRAPQRLLELGCGTGEDALWLARHGVEVVATDASSKMIEVARQKFGREDNAAPVAFHCLPMERLGMLADKRPFDGVFSNFGAINCVSDLPGLIAEIADRLVPGARLVWVVMGRHVPWEWLWYVARGEPAKAFRRYSRQGAQWRGMRIAYPTPKQMAALLMPYFEIAHVAPLGWALPPTYAAGWVDRSPRALAALSKLEGLAHGCAALAKMADHYIIEARRRPAT